jgi:adenylate kinase
MSFANLRTFFPAYSDGFPRAMDQAHEFEATISKCRMVLYFSCPLSVLEQRLLERGKTSGK